MSEEKEFTAEEIVDEVKEAAEEAAAEEAEAAVVAQDEKPEEKQEKKPSRREEKKKKKEDKEKDELITALESEKAALNDKFLRVCAEYDNFRRRSQKEKDALYGDIKANTVQQFLPVYDNLERALKQSTEDEAYRKGVEMIMAQFETTLEKLGVREIPSLGETFNPDLHNAVMHVEDEEKGENEIVEVFQKGFMLNDKVIRFAMVKVAN
ncbi:MAG: nucleotide exchange factor GrpE [Oscillospiraceae bacterium]|jgi:molecular chaperone GrpE|nr:nucleotide exchange factor GrpE [Oscillospiraceae bacterium]